VHLALLRRVEERKHISTNACTGGSHTQHAAVLPHENAAAAGLQLL
jgi:hypothetical protein